MSLWSVTGWLGLAGLGWPQLGSSRRSDQVCSQGDSGVLRQQAEACSVG